MTPFDVLPTRLTYRRSAESLPAQRRGSCRHHRVGKPGTTVVNMTTMMSVLGHLANTPTVHQELHLVTVEPELWNEISHHVETFSAATTTVEKARSYGDVMQLSGQSVELTSFINRLNDLSGG